MSKPTDDELAFKVINAEIDRLMKKLAAKGMCPCCVGQGLMYRGAFLHQEAVAQTRRSHCVLISLTRSSPRTRGCPKAIRSIRDEHEKTESVGTNGRSGRRSHAP